MRLANSLLLASWIGSAGLAQEQPTDAEAGRAAFEHCVACHEVGAEAGHRIGPHLNGLFGRSAASLPDFDYSDALRQLGRDGLVWNAETLDRFLEDPRGMAGGTRMSFAGLKDPQERGHLLAFLRRHSAVPPDSTGAEPAAPSTDRDLDPAILALDGDPDYGEYLAGECTGCHQVGGGDDGIPSIVAWPEEDFVVAMHAYKDGRRVHPVMQMIAGRLGAEEIAALAAYFAAVDRD